MNSLETLAPSRDMQKTNLRPRHPKKGQHNRIV